MVKCILWIIQRFARNLFYSDEYNKLSANKKKKWSAKHSFKNLALDDYDYLELTEEKSTNEINFFFDFTFMSPLEGNEEEIKEGTGIKILTPKKLSTRFPISLAQIKAGNNSYKVKYEFAHISFISKK